MTRDEVEQLLAMPKEVLTALQWRARDNHAGHVMAAAVLVDAEGVTLPGLTVQLEAKAPIITDRCLFHFSIMRRTPKGLLRVYQLEVCPHDKRSHNDKTGPLYGPHEHIGPDVASVSHPRLNCGDWGGCWEWFLQRCNLTAPAMQAPC